MKDLRECIRNNMRYIVFDLEATCWQKGLEEGPNEIIEIGAVKLGENLEVIDIFSTFVKPIHCPQLSEFCQELTTIRQEDVDGAPVFDESMENFWKWIGSDGDDILFLSWGYYDKRQILRESIEKGYSGNIPQALEDRHISLKHEYAKVRGIKPYGMAKALQILGLPLEGTHHRGIDDAKNIAKVFQVVFGELSLPDEKSSKKHTQ